jgi:hypothetical protein
LIGLGSAVLTRLQIEDFRDTIARENAMTATSLTPCKPETAEETAQLVEAVV